MPNDKSLPKPETAPQQETGGDCVSRLVRFLMSDAGTIIVTGSGPLHGEVMAALVAAQKQGITVIFHEDPPPIEILEIQLMPPMPEINFAPLKRTHAERATPNQPWYAKFQKRRRRKF